MSIKYKAPAIKNMPTDHSFNGMSVGVSAATNEDVVWSKEVLRSLTSYDYNAEALLISLTEPEIRNKNLCRVAWLMSFNKVESTPLIHRDLFNLKDTKSEVCLANEDHEYFLKYISKSAKRGQEKMMSDPILRFLLIDSQLSFKGVYEKKRILASFVEHHCGSDLIERFCRSDKDLSRRLVDIAIKYKNNKMFETLYDLCTDQSRRSECRDWFKIALNVGNEEALIFLSRHHSEFLKQENNQIHDSIAPYVINHSVIPNARDILCDAGLSPNELLYWAVQSNKLDTANDLIEKHGANIHEHSEELLKMAISKGDAKRIAYLASHGIEVSEAIDKLSKPSESDPELVKNLQGEFSKQSIKLDLINWTKENDKTIVRSELTDTLNVKWYFHFDTETISTATFECGEKGAQTKVSSGTWQFSEFSNLELINQAADALNARGGKVEHYGRKIASPVALKPHKPSVTKAIQTPIKPFK